MWPTRARILLPCLVVLSLGLVATIARAESIAERTMPATPPERAVASAAVTAPEPSGRPPVARQAQPERAGSLDPSPSTRPGSLPPAPDKRTEARPAAASPRVVTFSYDASGRLTGVSYGDNRSISYAYDSGGNLLKAEVAAGSGATTPRLYLPLALSAFAPGW